MFYYFFNVISAYIFLDFLEFYNKAEIQEEKNNNNIKQLFLFLGVLLGFK